MVIIDTHCHLWEAKHLRSVDIEFFQGLANKNGWDPNLGMDETVDRLIRKMDKVGIDQAVVLALDTEFVSPDGLPAKKYNNYVAHQLQAYPDRLIGFCGIDPRREQGAIRELERCVHKRATQFPGLLKNHGVLEDGRTFHYTGRTGERGRNARNSYIRKKYSKVKNAEGV